MTSHTPGAYSSFSMFDSGSYTSSSNIGQIALSLLLQTNKRSSLVLKGKIPQNSFVHTIS